MVYIISIKYEYVVQLNSVQLHRTDGIGYNIYNEYQQ